LFVAWESDEITDASAAATLPLVLTPLASDGVVPEGASGALFLLDDGGLRAGIRSNWGTPRIRDGEHGPDVPWAALHHEDGRLGAHVIAYPSSDVAAEEEPLGWETRLVLDADTLAVIRESPRTSFTWGDL
jgi:hypothetical protein